MVKQCRSGKADEKGKPSAQEDVADDSDGEYRSILQPLLLTTTSTVVPTTAHSRANSDGVQEPDTDWQRCTPCAVEMIVTGSLMD